MNKKYRVTWDIIMDAKSPVEAAMEAALAIRAKKNAPLEFTVKELCIDGTESLLSSRVIDLSEYYYCAHCAKNLSDVQVEDSDPEEAIARYDGPGVICPECNNSLEEWAKNI